MANLCRTILRCLRRNVLLAVSIVLMATYANQSFQYTSIDLQDIWQLSEQRSLGSLVRVDCDPAYHTGPFLFIETPTHGFFNQYLKLLSTVHLVRNFNGTIVFPQFSMTRENYADFYETRWTLVDSKRFYDVDYLVRYWKERNVTMCQGSAKLNSTSDWLNVTNFCTQIVPFRMKQLGHHALPIVKQYCNRAGDLNLDPIKFTSMVQEYFEVTENQTNYNFSNSRAISVTPAWNLLPPHYTYVKKSDAILLAIRDSALSLKFSPKIMALGAEILTKIKAKQKFLGAENEPTVGVHARIEKDWFHRTATVTGAEKVLDEFQWKIKQLTNSPGMVYVAVGDLDPDTSQMLKKWGNVNFGDRWILKKSMGVEKKMREIPMEAQAAVDLVVMSGVDYFLGLVTSSFDIVTCEFRSYLRRGSNLLGVGTLNEFRPFLTLRRCNF